MSCLILIFLRFPRNLRQERHSGVRTQRCPATSSSWNPLSISAPTRTLEFQILPSHFPSAGSSLLSSCSFPDPHPNSPQVPALLANSWGSFITSCLPALAVLERSCLVPSLSPRMQLLRDCIHPSLPQSQTERDAAPEGGGSRKRLRDPCPPIPASHTG